MTTKRPPPPKCQTGTAWSPTLHELDVCLVFRPDDAQWFFLDLNTCNDVPYWVAAGLSMDAAQRKTFIEVTHDVHGKMEVGFFSRLEPGEKIRCNLGLNCQ